MAVVHISEKALRQWELMVRSSVRTGISEVADPPSGVLSSYV